MNQKNNKLSKLEINNEMNDITEEQAKERISKIKEQKRKLHLALYYRITYKMLGQTIMLNEKGKDKPYSQVSRIYMMSLVDEVMLKATGDEVDDEVKILSESFNIDTDNLDIFTQLAREFEYPDIEMPSEISSFISNLLD